MKQIKTLIVAAAMAFLVACGPVPQPAPVAAPPVQDISQQQPVQQAQAPQQATQQAPGMSPLVAGALGAAGGMILGRMTAPRAPVQQAPIIIHRNTTIVQKSYAPAPYRPSFSSPRPPRVSSTFSSRPSYRR